MRTSLEILRPPPNLTVSEWADKYRRLSPETSASPGRWRTSRVPYMREIMDALNDPFTTGVVIKKSAQVAGTEFILNAIGCIAHIDPGPILLLEPKESDVRKFSIKRLAPMIRDTPVLRDRFVTPKSRDTGNTIEFKKFTGGDITMVGVNSPSNLSSLPIRFVFSDEDDRQAASSGDEGDPWELAWKRTTTYNKSRKAIRVSTPALAGSSRICAAYDDTDRRLYHVPCPACGALHPITRDMLVWEKTSTTDPTPAPGTARLVCPHCQARYDDDAKNAAISHSRACWQPTTPSTPFRGWRGYFIWAAYSPFNTLDELASDIHAARASGDPAKIQVLENTLFGEPYSGVSEKIDNTKIAARAERYPAAVPRRVLILTAGLDTQDDRIEAEVVGWGLGEESWSIDYRVFPGDPDIPEGQPGSPWDAVTAFLATRYRHETGLDMPVSSAAIDTGGHKTQAVYAYCQSRRATIHPIKGKGGFERDEIQGPTRRRFGGRKTRYVFLYTLGVDRLKIKIVGRLQFEPDPSDPTAPLPGLCHFPLGRDPSYYEQLTAEHLCTTRRGRRLVTEWKKETESARNEALDCRVYAYAAFLIRAPNLAKIAMHHRRKLATLATATAMPPSADAPAPVASGHGEADPNAPAHAPDTTAPAPAPVAPAAAHTPPAQDAQDTPRQNPRRHATRATRTTRRATALRARLFGHRLA